MALRVARGLFRLWLVLSVLWIGGVAVETWWTFPPNEWVDYETGLRAPYQIRDMFDDPARAAIRFASILALVPPALLLALGSALVWALRGFRG
jgi:hypothetical protein